MGAVQRILGPPEQKISTLEKIIRIAWGKRPRFGGVRPFYPLPLRPEGPAPDGHGGRAKAPPIAAPIGTGPGPGPAPGPPAPASGARSRGPAPGGYSRAAPTKAPVEPPRGRASIAPVPPGRHGPLVAP